MQMLPLVIIGGIAAIVYKLKNSKKYSSSEAFELAVKAIKKWEGLASKNPIYRKVQPNDYLTTYNDNTILYAYNDGAGNATIGWGLTTFKGNKVTFNTKCTVKEAETELRKKLTPFFNKVETNFLKFGLSNNQVAALTSYFFNRGYGNAFINVTSAVSFFKTLPIPVLVTNWFLQNWGTASSVKNGLIARRTKEAKLYNENIIV